MSTIWSDKDLFGDKIYYENGIKIGYGQKNLLGYMNYYNADYNYAGCSVNGIVSDSIYYDANNNYIGKSYDGIIDGVKNFYDSSNSYVGYSQEGLFGEEVYSY